jgi:membrane protease YdiL (CAAX protease family)
MNENMTTTGIETSVKARAINWKQVAAFLGLTFGLTWALDLAIYLLGGLSTPAISLALQFQMLLPAAAAIILGLFFFKDSPLYRTTNRAVSRWFIYFYLALTALYTVGTVTALFRPELVQIISTALLAGSAVGLILLVVLRIVGKYNSFASVNMAGGKPLAWLIFGVGLVLFYGLQTGLNWLFKLGNPVDIQTLLPQLQLQTLPNSVILASIALNTILIGPFLGLIISFGEEYGWRGYLQSALLPLGKIKAILLLGVIWGVWHWPIIWMGYNYPGQPILGSLVMTLYTIALAFVLGYAVLKTKGIWLAAFLHALNNQTLSFLNGFIYAPKNNILSFSAGILGILCFAVVIAIILRDPIWKD